MVVVVVVVVCNWLWFWVVVPGLQMLLVVVSKFLPRVVSEFSRKIQASSRLLSANASAEAGDGDSIG